MEAAERAVKLTSLSCRLFGNELALFRTCHPASSGEKSPRLIDSLFVLTTNLRFVSSVSAERRDDEQAEQNFINRLFDHFPVNNSDDEMCAESISLKIFFADDCWHLKLCFASCFGCQRIQKHFLHQTRWKGIRGERDVIWGTAGGAKDKNYWHTEPNIQNHRKVTLTWRVFKTANVFFPSESCREMNKQPSKRNVFRCTKNVKEDV